MQHSKQTKSAHFITLTYEIGLDQEGTLPRLTDSGYPTLRKRDTQLFFKRLRKQLHGNGRSNITYYLAGEYGSNTARPHYHAIVFNATTTAIKQCWTYGAVHFGSVTGASIGYCLKYISKGRTVPKYRGDDRQPEFSLMSKRIGANYLTPAMIKWHHEDLLNRAYATLPGGTKCSLPRYYKDKLYVQHQRDLLSQHFQQKLMAELELLHHPEWFTNRELHKQRIAASYRAAATKSKNDDKI